DIHDYRLGRRQPGRERSGVMFDQHADETFKRPQDRTVQHDRTLAVVVFGDIAGVQALRQVRIILQRAALPVAPQAVAQGELDLRPVEGTLARLIFPGQPGLVQRLGQRTLGAIPQLIGTYALGGASRELHGDIGEAEVRVDLQGQPDEVGRFLLHLILGAEDVRIVLHEATHAHDAVQRTGRLVAVTGTELGQTQRQVAVGLQALIEDLHVTRAVHRLDGVVAVFRGSGEHVLGV